MEVLERFVSPLGVPLESKQDCMVHLNDKVLSQSYSYNHYSDKVFLYIGNTQAITGKKSSKNI
jgi:hypothetical protein